MRAYVLTTGIAFALLVIAHAARIAAEGLQLAKDPFFMIATIVSAGLCVWAGSLLRRRGEKHGS